MNGQLVAKGLLVLEVFCAQNNISGMGKNEILRATSSKDKPVIFKTINFLKKARILEFKKVKQGKKTIVTLTPLGKEIVHLIIDIEKSKGKYNVVMDKTLEYSLLKENENHTYMEKLLQKGWKQEELSSFIDVILSLLRIIDIYRKNIYNSLIYRYYYTLASIEVNEDAKAVLIKIIISAITYFISTEPTPNMIQPRFSDHHIRFENLSKSILEEIEKVYKPDKMISNPYQNKIISNRFTSEEIAGLMSSLVCILKPTREDLAFTRVKSEIERMKKDIESFEKDRGVRDEISRCYLNNLEDLAKIHENCITRYGDYLDEIDEV
jgi:hypothetical protein